MKASSSVFWIKRPKRRNPSLAGRESLMPEDLRDDVLVRVSKLIPAEVVGVYLSGRQIAESNNAIGSWSIVCLLICIFLRAATTRDPDKSWEPANVQWDAVAYATISFSIWVYAMGDQIGGITLGQNQFWASLLAIGWPVVASQLVALPARS